MARIVRSLRTMAALTGVGIAIAAVSSMTEKRREAELLRRRQVSRERPATASEPVVKEK